MGSYLFDFLGAALWAFSCSRINRLRSNRLRNGLGFEFASSGVVHDGCQIHAIIGAIVLPSVRARLW
jgi:hypothetical protein